MCSQTFGDSDRKESACNAGDMGSIPGLGRSPGGGHSNPLQYSCLENPADRKSWWAVVHRIAKSQTRLRQPNTHAHLPIQYDFHSRCMGVYVCVQSLSQDRVSVGRWKIWEMDDGESCLTIYLYIEPLKMYGLFSRWVMYDSFVTLWTVAHKASLSMGLQCKNTGVGCHFLLHGIFVTHRSNLCLLCWQADFLPLCHLGKAKITNSYLLMALQMYVSTADSSLQPQNEPLLTIIWSFDSFIEISLQMLHKHLKGRQSHVFLKSYPLYFSHFPIIPCFDFF